MSHNGHADKPALHNPLGLLHEIEASTLSVFMKLSALALSKGFPRPPIEPTSPWSASRLR
jgi:hypothetical protein